MNYNILTMDLTILNNSLIGRDFLRLKDKQEPTIDEFLEYRKRMMELKELKKYPTEWYDYEIQAVDEILKYYSEA